MEGGLTAGIKRTVEAGCVALVSAAAAIVVYERVLTRPTPAEIVDAFHMLSYNKAETWQTNRWLGVMTQQNPNDVWITQEIISEQRPDYVVETGTYHGGSAVIWAMILDQIHQEGRVITIDVKDMVGASTRPPIARSKIDYLIGSSTAPEIVSEVARRTKGKRVLVILDSDHSREHVLAELAAYAPMVNVGSYLIVQDTNVNGHPVLPSLGPGPMEAVQEFLATHDEFVSDRRRERLLFTYHPRGYLKRVR